MYKPYASIVVIYIDNSAYICWIEWHWRFSIIINIGFDRDQKIVEFGLFRSNSQIAMFSLALFVIVN